MSKKWFNLLIVLLITASLLIGCTGDKKDPSESKDPSDATPTPGSSEEVIDDGVPEMDLDNYEFVIAEAWYYDATDRPSLEPGTSDLSDAIIERNAEIEERFNCTIVYDYYDPVSFYDTVYPILMSGEKFADVMTPTLFNYGRFFNGDYLYDLDELPYVNLDEPYWYDIYDEAAVTVDGRRLGAASFIANPFRRVFGVFFNKRLIEEQNLDNPYDLVAADEWDWENFSRLINGAMRDVNNDAVFDDNDVFSVTGGLDGGIQALYLTSGNKMFDVDEEGLVRYAMTDSNVMSTLTQLKDMFSAPGSYYSGSWDASRCTDNFVDGNVTFYLNLAAKSPHLRNMEDDYGLVPFPKAPGQTEYISAIDHNSAIICVPYTIDNPEATGAVLQALSAASVKERQIWEAELEALNFRDEESYKNIEEFIFPGITFDPLFMYHRLAPEFFKYTTTTIWEPVVRDRALDAATLINEGKEATQTLIDEIINKVPTGE